jgi:riboflavin synthase
MFTGIIEETGAIASIRRENEGAVIDISARQLPPTLKTGDSIAVNGVCLTVTFSNETGFSCGLSAETLERTSFRRMKKATIVNLERPLTAGSRLGGHFVLGHVDDTGWLLHSTMRGAGADMTFRFPRELDRYLVYKGSVAVDGISLTLASLREDSFSVAVIPHTLQSTNLGSLGPGDPVNLEVDILGKYFERYFRLGISGRIEPRLTAEYLKEQGF